MRAVRRRGVSPSVLVREALDERLGGEARTRAGSCLDLAAGLAGILAGPADLSSNAKHVYRRNGRKSIPTRLPPKARSRR